MSRVPMVAVFGAISASLFLGAVGASLLHRHTVDVAQMLCQEKYPLTNQSLDCADYEASSALMDALNAKLQAAIDLDIKQNRAKRVSIWVRNLETKQYATINPLDTFAPASLLKLPLAIVYKKFAEIQPAIMQAQTTYSTSKDLNERFNAYTATTSLEVGRQYSTEELLRRMIVSSDNGAYFSLLSHVEKDFYDKVMLDLGIQIPSNDGVLNFMNVKAYAAIFRTLYNSSYLGRMDSQNLLDLMSQTDFKGIAAPLPRDIRVAHKFGERSVFDQNGRVISRELHDCGIVYKGATPYTICIMTEGSDFNALHGVIKDLSKIVYDSI